MYNFVNIAFVINCIRNAVSILSLIQYIRRPGSLPSYGDGDDSNEDQNGNGTGDNED